MIYTLLFFAALAAAGGYVAWRRIASMLRERRRTWIVPLSLLDSVLPGIERAMIASGFGKEDYVLNVKDCSEYAPEWLGLIEAVLSPHRPRGETEWAKEYSFQRDLRDNGDDPGRHRVVAIKTDAGMKYIDTYRIDGSLYRTLSLAEQAAGYYR